MPDHAVREISMARPCLRRDVRTHYQEFRGKPSYIVEDTANGKFFHVGFPEHQFIQALDGRTTVSQALARNAATQGEDALTQQQADQVLRWLIDGQLLQTDSSDQAGRRRDGWERKQEDQPGGLFQKLLFFKIPLGCPDRFLAKVTPFTSWIFSLPGLILWFILLIFAGLEIAPHWDRFISSAGQVIAPGNWWRIALVYVFLKILHEIGHGIAVKKYGGEIPSWGAQLLLFVTPLAYLDASASWRFGNRWHRILVSAAGMFVEIALAAICMIAWVRTDPGALNTALHSAIIAATMVTVLFNANPLMRFDGYHILVDLLGIPNLGTKGNQFLKWFGKRFLLGMKVLPFPPAIRPHPIAIPVYGVLAALWKIIIWIGILALLTFMLKGAGIFLALISVIAILWKSVSGFVKFAVSGSGPRFVQAAPRLAFLVILTAALFYFVKVDPTGRSIGVVEFANAVKIRAGCDGQVVAVETEPDKKVEAGEILLRMTNPNEETARAQLALELASARIRARRFYQDEKLSAYQAELETITGLEKKLAERTAYIDSLTVRAPVTGRVIGKRLDSLPGKWLRVGEEILSITPDDEKTLLISISQKDIEPVRKRGNDAIICRLRGRPAEMSGNLTVVETRASRSVPHDSLISSNGGPLPVQNPEPLADSARRADEIASDSGRLDRSTAAKSDAELADPRFAARAVLESGQSGSSDLKEGEWGFVRLSAVDQERLGVWIFEATYDFLRRRFAQTKAATQS